MGLDRKCGIPTIPVFNYTISLLVIEHAQVKGESRHI